MALSTGISAKALAAFDRNDVRGTYRDPLLVMIVVAPVIWTSGVALLTPRVTDMLADRYSFAFGVLPPYWAAKAFWVASAHGSWWPYLVGGASTTWPSVGCCFAASSPRTPDKR
jgi:hypothetical protein